jgi:hypothetical protein
MKRVLFPEINQLLIALSNISALMIIGFVSSNANMLMDLF